MRHAGTLAGATGAARRIDKLFRLGDRNGHPGGADSILDSAREQGCDLIVMARMDGEGGRDSARQCRRSSHPSSALSRSDHQEPEV